VTIDYSLPSVPVRYSHYCQTRIIAPGEPNEPLPFKISGIAQKSFSQNIPPSSITTERIAFTMKATRQLGKQSLLAIAATILPLCSARAWVDVVDPSIYAAALRDAYRADLILEKNPFDYDDSETSEEVINTAPTMAPTRRDEMLLENGGCPMDQFLYRVRLHDRWGDGWENVPIRILEMPHATSGGAVLEEFTGEHNATHIFSTETAVKKSAKLGQSSSAPPVVIFEDSMGQGYDGYSYVCLKIDQCYTAAMDSGLWDGEIKWDVQSALRPKGIVTVAKGVAPAKCQFSIAESANSTVCPNVCDLGVEGDEANTAMPSDLPSMVPSSAPSGYDGASGVPSDLPSLIPSSSPSWSDFSDPPSMIPTEGGAM
jgi:hypothetical protein